MEEEARATRVNFRIVVLLAAFLAFLIAAGIVTEALKFPEWGGLLKGAFGVVSPALFGYFAGEFVAEKTK